MTGPRWSWLRLLFWVILYAALAFLLSWSRDDETGRLIAAGALVSIASGLYLRLRAGLTARVHLLAAIALLGFGCAAGAIFAWRLHRLGTDWERLQTQRSALIRETLDQRMRFVLDQGQQAAAEAANIPHDTARSRWFAPLEGLLVRSNVDAAILFGEQGELLAWAGEHRGPLPDLIRVRPPPVAFIERPLYSYLYFTAPLARRPGNAIIAILLDAELPSEAGLPDLAAQIDALAGSSAAFRPGAGSPSDWHLVVKGDTILHARIEALNQTDWRADLLRTVQRIEIAVAAVVLLLLCIGWFRELKPQQLGAAVVPFLGTAIAVVTAPLGPALRLEQIFVPGRLFLFPGPGDVSLGTMLALMLVTGVFVSAMRIRWRGHSPFWFVLAAILLALALPLIIVLLIGPTPASLWPIKAWTPTLIQGGPALWIGLQLAVVLLVAVLASVVLLIARLPSRVILVRRLRASYILFGASIATSSAFAILLLALARTRTELTPLLAWLWIVPLLLAGSAVATYPRDGRALLRWLIAGWIAGTAMLPYLWIAHVSERLQTAERELATLGTKPDVYLEYLLREFGREAISRRERGEDGLQLLYRSWLSSGLAREGYPARVSIWGADGRPEARLPLGDAIAEQDKPIDTVPEYLAETFARVQQFASPEVFTVHNVEDVHQVMVAPLDSGRMATVEVPPRRTLDRASVIAPILGAETDPGTRLELVEKRTAGAGGVWQPTSEGWRSEVPVHFPNGVFHAHLHMRLPGLHVQVARGVLILTGALLLMLALWLIGRALRGEPVTPKGGWFSWLTTFRGRITATLFAFFLLPTAVFGWVAYSALALEVTRAARTVAERAVKQAVVEFSEEEVGGDLRELAAHTGNQVLLFFQGELHNVSSPEALELGVYNALMPAHVFLALESGEEEAEVATRQLGGQNFITAFRRLPPQGTATLAVPISLQGGETVLRQTEMAHLILFAALVGALLSLALSVVVGRALAGPIGRLQRAAAAVGEGRLRVQLPEQTGEFGTLFASFNRMVRRLQRARAREVHTARVLAWGQMARQVAHEIKNPLTPIKLAVQHLRRAFRDPRGNFEDVLDRSVDQILVEIDRLSEIARVFSRYGAPAESAGPLEPVHVSSVVQEALTLYRAGDPLLDYLDQVERGLPLVLARSGELKEVLLNLLENARAATPPPGRITVSAHRNGNSVELSVADTGVGIPAEMLPQIFEPHFSTRTTGTGLGLAIVRRLAESWNGSVQAESETGRGTVIRVRLLIAETGSPIDSGGN